MDAISTTYIMAQLVPFSKLQFATLIVRKLYNCKNSEATHDDLKMKHVTFGLILICCYAWPIRGNDYYNSAVFKDITSAFEKIKTIMRNGNESLGIPILDPFNAEEMPIKINKNKLNLDALLTNVNAENLSKFIVNKGDFALIGMTLMMNLSWSLITANTNYTMNCKVGNFHIYGIGEMRMSANDFGFATEIGFTLKDSRVQVKNLKTSLSLKALDFHATGLLDDNDLSKLLSAIISDMVPQLINDYHDRITDELNLVVIKKLNSFLSNKTLRELLDLLLG